MPTIAPHRRGLRAALLAVVAAAALLLVPVAPTGAQDEPDPSAFEEGMEVARDSRIVGGTTAGTGAWPSMVSVQFGGSHGCGGTLIATTWVLTAAHCLLDPGNGWYPSPASTSVRLGSKRWTTGGTVIGAAEFRIYPGWPQSYYDLALIRLTAAAPASIPLQPFIGQGGVVAAGTSVTAAGWGYTVEGGGVLPDALRQVTVTLRSTATCQAAYGSDFVSSVMVCANVGGGGKDTCQGDSGGPLFFRQGSTWVQLGVTSWGYGCARAGYPGVYTRVAAFSNWMNRTINKYGGHSDANAFVRQSYLDLHRRQPTTTELRNGASSLNLNTRTAGRYASDLIQGSAYQQRTGGVARLYSAFFLRNPDTPGLGYWWQQVNSGRSLQRIANIMASSSEFIDRYGSLNNGAYVDLVYQNVLGRPPDASGRSYWIGELNAGRKTRGEVMANFSESSEYRTANKARVDVIISYFGLVRRVPSSGDITYWSTRSNVQLTTVLVGSAEYRNRVT